MPTFKKIIAFLSGFSCKAYLVLLFLVANNKALCQISLNISVTNISTELFFGSQLEYSGSINAIASGGTDPYLFHVILPSGGNVYQNNGYYPGLGAGLYTIIVTDANGKSDSATATVGFLYTQPTLNYSNLIMPTDCDSGNGSFTLNASGGTPPYAYSIDGGLTYAANNIFSKLTSGFYSAVVKDVNGQMAFIEDSNYRLGITLEVPYCNFRGVAETGGWSCTNEGNMRVVGSSYPLPKMDSFSLDNINFRQLLLDTTLFDGIGTDYIYSYDTTGLGPGLYHVYFKDNLGNKAVQAGAFIKECYIKITFIGIDASCHQSDGAITVIAANGTPPYRYTIDGINYQTSNVFSGLTSGNYSVGVKDAVGVFNYSTATVYNKCPTVTAIETDESCGQINGSITVTGHKGTTPYQFSINNIDFQAGNFFSNVPAGTYNLTIKDAKGFTDSTSVTVYNNCVQLSLVTVKTTCSKKNGSIIATASNAMAPYTYSIDGLNFRAANKFDSLVAGSYTVIAKDANGLTKDSTVTVTDAPAPKLGVAVTNATCRNTNGSVNITATGGAIPLKYSIDNGITYQLDNIFNSLDSGLYVAIVEDSNSCIAKDTFQITAPPKPDVFIGNDTTICNGETFLLSTPMLPDYQYLWQDGSASNTLLVTTRGAYSVTVTNQFNCIVSDTINIGYRPLPVFYLGNDTSLCSGKTLLLQPLTTPSGTYLWNTGSASRSLNLSSGGVYWLQVSDSGCAKRDSITITYKPSPIVNLGNDSTLCSGNALTLNATNNNASYLWQDGSTQPLFTVNGEGTYSVKVDLNGCDTSGKINISYSTKPLVQLGGDTTLCMNENLVLNAYYPHSSFLWQDGSASPQFNVTKEGTYSVSVTNTCGAVNSSINVLYKNCACKFYVPSAFTPNNDGKNDMFRTQYSCFFSSYEMRVFNRFGQQVFFSNSASIGWDGTFKNESQPADIYIWELKYKDSLTGTLMQKNGTVMLMR